MGDLQLAGAIAGFVALVLSILINLRQLLALFASGECLISSGYHGPTDLIGWASKPRFFLMFENKRSVPMDFRHFELLLPRLDGVISGGEFVAHQGAELFKDGQPTGSRLKARQEYKKIDFLTRVVRVEPHSSEAEFFELDAFLPERPPKGWGVEPRLPSDFKPVLQFRQAAGEQEFHCDELGIHPGPYHWPHERELLAIRKVTPAKVVELRRSRFLRRWSVEQRDADIGPDAE
jgi:hypothetical protein